MRKTLPLIATLALTAALAVPLPGAAQDRVQFATGMDTAALESSVTGDDFKDYLLGARAGQTMSVSLIGSASANFNILPPGSSGEAIYIGSMDGPDATITLPADGDYTIRVYLMGNARDSGETVPFTLSMTIM